MASSPQDDRSPTPHQAELIASATKAARGVAAVHADRLHSVCNDVFRLTFARGLDAVMKIYARGHGADARRRGDRAIVEREAMRLLAAGGAPVPAVEAEHLDADTPWLLMTSAGPAAAGNIDGLDREAAASVYWQCGELLARVHAVGESVRAGESGLPAYNASDGSSRPIDPGFRWALGRIEAEKRATGPVLDRLRQAATRRPDVVTLCHSDFHPDQCVRDGGRVTVVTDWESAHFGDPVADYAKLANYLAVFYDPYLGRETLAGYALIRRPPAEDDRHYRTLRALQVLNASPRHDPRDVFERRWLDLADALLPSIA